MSDVLQSTQPLMIADTVVSFVVIVASPQTVKFTNQAHSIKFITLRAFGKNVLTMILA